MAFGPDVSIGIQCREWDKTPQHLRCTRHEAARRAVWSRQLSVEIYGIRPLDLFFSGVCFAFVVCRMHTAICSRLSAGKSVPC